ncbi:MAG: hypothetical protein QOH35_3418 [Acidobacteriaceae bacterium]|jgi:hypothetical protein|nr:hypothetical protein [Acidobacteriaceae bacterium]MEA2260113.1 hypothetical protein [Acidobacteriaceae bacterium]MEA2542052.1 hypothetical protein [Acidobacteriaceae bacterium]
MKAACGKGEFFARHGSNVLYQGTTLVGPYNPAKEPGF